MCKPGPQSIHTECSNSDSGHAHYGDGWWYWEVPPIPESILWHTYGKPFKMPGRKIRLGDCTTEHLLAILETQWQIRGTTVETAIYHILGKRGVTI
jgi:hypothetical protein